MRVLSWDRCMEVAVFSSWLRLLMLPRFGGLAPTPLLPSPHRAPCSAHRAIPHRRSACYRLVRLRSLSLSPLRMRHLYRKWWGMLGGRLTLTVASAKSFELCPAGACGSLLRSCLQTIGKDLHWALEGGLCILVAVDTLLQQGSKLGIQARVHQDSFRK